MAKSAAALERKFRDQMNQFTFSDPVAYVYNPLDYAWALHSRFIKMYGEGRKRVLFLGMNPGPFGMAQTGVPFGEVSIVRDWLKIEGKVKKPDPEHPKRPVTGFDCHRKEVSGERLWGYFRERFKTPKAFFKDNYVINYCPLIFMEPSGRNITPDKLKIKERKELYQACNEHLYQVVSHYKPEYLIGVGKFAESRANEVLGDLDVRIGQILHPSPASPIANRGWAKQAEAEIRKIGAW